MQPCLQKNPKKKQPLSPKNRNKKQPRLSNLRQHKKPWCPLQEPKQEAAETINKTYLKAMPLKELTDIDNVKNEVKNGNIIILRVTPLANKSIDDVKNCRKPALRIRRIRRRRHCTLGRRASGYLSKKYQDLARKNAGF